MLPTTLVSMKPVAQLRHHDVEQVPAEEGHGGREHEGAEAPAQLGELRCLVQPVVDGIVS